MIFEAQAEKLYERVPLRDIFDWKFEDLLKVRTMKACRVLAGFDSPYRIEAQFEEDPVLYVKDFSAASDCRAIFATMQTFEWMVKYVGERIIKVRSPSLYRPHKLTVSDLSLSRDGNKLDWPSVMSAHLYGHAFYFLRFLGN